jgi:CubicO group peptidase (beta-lactamase class C family)
MDLSMSVPDLSSPPLETFEQQDKVFARAFSILQSAILQRAFPAAVVAITHRGRLIALKALGCFTYEPDSPSATPATLFDLASLTKAVATTSMAMLLYERGLLDLDVPVSAIVRELIQDPARDPRRHGITLRTLLAHSSGLPAYEKLFLKTRTRAELLEAAFITPLATNPATRADYSDIGFIILGIALERLADESTTPSANADY